MQKRQEILDFIGNATTDVRLMVVLTFRRIQGAGVSIVHQRLIPHKRTPECRTRTKLGGQGVQNQHLWAETRGQEAARCIQGVNSKPMLQRKLIIVQHRVQMCAQTSCSTSRCKARQSRPAKHKPTEFKEQQWINHYPGPTKQCTEHNTAEQQHKIKRVQIIHRILRSSYGGPYEMANFGRFWGFFFSPLSAGTL